MMRVSAIITLLPLVVSTAPVDDRSRIIPRAGNTELDYFVNEFQAGCEPNSHPSECLIEFNIAVAGYPKFDNLPTITCRYLVESTGFWSSLTQLPRVDNTHCSSFFGQFLFSFSRVYSNTTINNTISSTSSPDSCSGGGSIGTLPSGAKRELSRLPYEPKQTRGELVRRWDNVSNETAPGQGYYLNVTDWTSERSAAHHIAAGDVAKLGGLRYEIYVGPSAFGVRAKPIDFMVTVMGFSASCVHHATGCWYTLYLITNPSYPYSLPTPCWVHASGFAALPDVAETTCVPPPNSTLPAASANFPGDTVFTFAVTGRLQGQNSARTLDIKWWRPSAAAAATAAGKPATTHQASYVIAGGQLAWGGNDTGGPMGRYQYYTGPENFTMAST